MQWQGFYALIFVKESVARQTSALQRAAKADASGENPRMVVLTVWTSSAGVPLDE